MKRLLQSFVTVALPAFLFFLWSCQSAAAPQAQETKPEVPELNFATKELWESHWRKHAVEQKEFGKQITKEEYLQYARVFFNADPKVKLFKYRPNGDKLHYKPDTNEFGVLSSKNIIRTYFRPRDGRRYWDRQ